MSRNISDKAVPVQADSSVFAENITSLDNSEIEKLINSQMGVEDDVDGIDCTADVDDSEDEIPFDADSIRIDQQILSLKYVYELYQEGVLKLNPDFQRRYVWGDRRKRSLLIESLMLRIPIPAFYFYEKKDGTFLVIDGQQRLKTIFDFLDGGFALIGLEYLGDQFDKKKYDELTARYQQRIKRTQLAVNILDERSPSKVVFDIFRRVNTGGVSLNPQEMRNAICSDSTRELLKAGASSEPFKKATRDKIKGLRLDDQEVFLRFITLYRRYDYTTHRLDKLKPSKLTPLMDKEITEIDRLSREDKDRLLSAYETSMIRCRQLFGDLAFVKLTSGSDGQITGSSIINKSLLVAFTVLLADPCIYSIDLSDKRELVLKTLAEQMQDISYMNSITKATGDERNILICFEKSLEVLEACRIIDPSSKGLN